MENRYLFRGKRIDNGEWVQGYLYGIWEKRYILWGMTNDIPNMIEVDPTTICPCTGLKDKNGKLIWENDIVGYYDKYMGKWCYGLVGYGEFNCSCCGGVYGWHFGDEDIREYKGYEVKGNKFDNPELLEV